MKKIIVISIQILGLLLLQNPIYAHQPFGIADKNQNSYIEISDAKISHAFYGVFENKDQEMELQFNLEAGDKFIFSLLIYIYFDITIINDNNYFDNVIIIFLFVYL